MVIRSRECPSCKRRYPVRNAFRYCEPCEGEPACINRAAPPSISEKDATSLFRHAEFERRYAAEDWTHPEKRNRTTRLDELGPEGSAAIAELEAHYLL